MTLLFALLASSPALAGLPEGRAPQGPASVEVDLLRTAPGGPRIYVQALLPDGEPGLFMVDTGADLSILSRRTAERLGLTLDQGAGEVVGLGGSAQIAYATLPSLRFGDMVVPRVRVGVDVPGMPTRAGAMELDGLLGNNVWSRFALEIDYPADRLTLHKESPKKQPRRSVPMVLQGLHVFVPITLEPKGGEPHSVVLQLDTGAGELSICGALDEGLAGRWTEGLEPVLGLGASERLPPFRNLRTTRRIPLEGVELAERSIPGIQSARWMSFDRPDGCPEGMRGLIGHELLKDHRIVLDYAERTFSMGRSRGKRSQLDGHAVLLEQELARGPSTDRAFYRALLALRLERLEQAEDELTAALANPASAAEAAVLLAHLHRHRGRADLADEVLERLSVEELTEQGLLVAAVNGHLVDGRLEEGRRMAEEATAKLDASMEAWVARSDAELAAHEPESASASLRRAVELAGFPDAHLFRRARVAHAAGDRDAALAHVRRLLHLYPMGGSFLYFYALQVADDGERATFLADLRSAMQRLHPEHRPLDFEVAAYQTLGMGEPRDEALAAGLARDCAPMEGPTSDNCEAWYLALAGARLDEALTLSRKALEAEGERADFLDTLAMVHLARGEVGDALHAAEAAVRLSPDDTYMLWQAERIRAIER